MNELGTNERGTIEHSSATSWIIIPHQPRKQFHHLQNPLIQQVSPASFSIRNIKEWSSGDILLFYRPIDTASDTMASSPTVSSPSKSSKVSQQSSTTATSQPEKAHSIDVLPTPVAQTYSHIHPTVLLALYSLRFSSLVSDPVSTLWSDLPLYTALQTAYVLTCLPQAGSSHQHYSHGETGSGEVADVKKTPSSSGKRKRHAAGNKSDTLSQKLTVRHSLPFFFFNIFGIILTGIGDIHSPYINLPPRHTSPVPPSHPLRCLLYDAYGAYGAMCRAYGSTHRNAAGICPRRRQ